MASPRLKQLARALALGAAAPLAAGVLVGVLISLTMSFTYLTAGGSIDPALARARVGAVQSLAPLLAGALTAAAALSLARQQGARALTTAAIALGSSAIALVLQAAFEGLRPFDALIFPCALAEAGAGAALGARGRDADLALVAAAEALRGAATREDVLRAVGLFQGPAGLARASLYATEGPTLRPIARAHFGPAPPPAEAPPTAAPPDLEARGVGAARAAGGGVSLWVRLPEGGALLELGLARRRLARRRRPALWRSLAAHVSQALRNLELVEEACDAALRRERERMSEEIHDTLAQDLVSAVVHLEAAEQRLGAGDGAAAGHLREAMAATRAGLSQARRLVWASRERPGPAPPPGEPASLEASLAGAVANWSERSGVAARFAREGRAAEVDGEIAAFLLRAAREALTNVRKHACASEVRVTLTYAGDALALDVTDDGVGFDPAARRAPGAGFGLLAIAERSRALGGDFGVESEAGRHTTFSLQMPRTLAARGPA